MRSVRFQETHHIALYDLPDHEDIAHKTGPLFAPFWLRRCWTHGLKQRFPGRLTELHGDVKLETAMAVFETAWETAP